MVEQVQSFVRLSWLFYAMVVTATPSFCGLLAHAHAQALEADSLVLPFGGGPRAPLATPTICSLGAPLLCASWDVLFHGGGDWEAVEASASRGRANTRPHASYCWAVESSPCLARAQA